LDSLVIWRFTLFATATGHRNASSDVALILDDRRISMIASTFGAKKSFARLLLTLLGSAALIGNDAAACYAQAPITPSGLNTQISTSPTSSLQYDITGGTRPGNGTNLFHSFGEFGVPGNHIANFLNDAGLPTTNILGRVTGGNPSSILGTVQTTGFGSANLFLMNPAGIVFGPNASLNVGGSVNFSTADYFRLGDGVKFTAIPGQHDGLLSSAPVAAFGFLGATPGTITLQGGEIAVSASQNISLVGGDITVHGMPAGVDAPQSVQLKASGGHIHVASVASPGEILVATLETAPNINGKSFGALGTVTLSENAIVETIGGGTIVIRSGRFLIDNSRLSTNVVGPPTEAAGNIQIDADSVLIQNHGVISTSNAGTKSTATERGNISIFADRFVSMTNGATVSANSRGPQNAGNITINGGSQFMSNHSSVAAESLQASGGNITIRATDAIRLANSTISTSIAGDFFSSGGDITLDPRVVTLQNSHLLASAVNGSGGTISIRAGLIFADQNSLMSASSQIVIQSPMASLSGTLAVLPQRFLLAHNLSTRPCAAAHPDGLFSTFRVAGRDMLPAEPGGWQLSPMAHLYGLLPNNRPNVAYNHNRLSHQLTNSIQTARIGAGCPR
jgi:filamentous hemagglutinin family protein